MNIEVKEVVCDWGVYEGGKLKLILNSRSAAEQIADIIRIDEYRHATDTPLRAALEKQIPKKTILRRTDEGSILHKCPSCSEDQLSDHGCCHIMLHRLPVSDLLPLLLSE